MEDNNFKRPWYKTGLGVTFLGLISLFIFVAVVFAGFFSYYAWQLKYGDAQKLVKEFTTENFSVDPELSMIEIDNIQEKDINKYIRDFNPVLYAGGKPITIIAFIDFECPFCHESYPIFKTVMAKYEPLVKVIFKNLPLENLHPGTELSANAAACAGEQNKFWDYYDGLFLISDHTDEGLINLAGQLNLNYNTFVTCLDASKYQNDISQDMMDAVDLGLIGTPTYFVNGYKVEGSMSLEEWDKIILDIYNKPR